MGYIIWVALLHITGVVRQLNSHLLLHSRFMYLKYAPSRALVDIGTLEYPKYSATSNMLANFKKIDVT